jgi:lipopolysaccharide/colanic/teichoic acid biosynthesis glycosyltransferase
MNNSIGLRLSRKNRVFDFIYSSEEFLELLRRERLRTLRNNIPFSVLTFKKVTDSADHKIFENLINVMLSRVRATDVIGLNNENNPALLLPDTPPEGADILAKDILTKIDESRQLVYEIQGYPLPNDLKVAEVVSGNGGSSKTAIGEGGPDNCRRSIRMEHGEIDELCIPPMPRWKRGADILIAGTSLVILFPLFLAIAAFIKTVSPGPVFFKQTRVGFRKKPFVCWKFRTMKVEADITVHQKYLKTLIKNENECMIKLDDVDPRIIPCGKILRKTGLDELPQLINILFGDMSLVGPRPCTTYEASEYLVWQQRRFDTNPGLTGLWQVSGKNSTSFVEMMRLDIGYAIRKNLLKDIWIMFKTIPAIIRQVFDRRGKKK